MVTGIVIPAGNDEPLRELDTTNQDAIWVAVDGLIDAVDLPDLGVSIYVNEAGLIRHLPFNSRASLLWWYHVPADRQRALLVGDAVIVGMPDEDGADTEVPAAAREMLLSSARYRVEVRTVGDPKWYRNQAIYPDYWEAIAWAMVQLERWTAAEDVRVIPAEASSTMS